MMEAAQDLVKQAVAAARAGRTLTARDLFQMAVRTDPQNELAWMWLTGLLDTVDERIHACQQVLRINPQNMQAAQYLARLHAERKTQGGEVQTPPAESKPEGKPKPRAVALSPIQQAELFEEQGNIQQALEAYRTAAATTDAKINKQAWDQIYRKIIDLENLRAEQIAHISPMLSIARLTAGPPLLYLMFMLIHIGINPFADPDPVAWLGILWVTLGGFLTALAAVKFHHPLWKRLGDKEGKGTPQTRMWISVAGWALVAIPHLILFSVAFYRLSLPTS